MLSCHSGVSISAGLVSWLVTGRSQGSWFFVETWLNDHTFVGSPEESLDLPPIPFEGPRRRHPRVTRTSEQISCSCVSGFAMNKYSRTRQSSRMIKAT
ncbi:hypothetical protein B0J14DRAFT_574617 [Halenospora varia]|nr:hypothetical protein B0J14DRAFT_574617 [Halenospora varia]